MEHVVVAPIAGRVGERPASAPADQVDARPVARHHRALTTTGFGYAQRPFDAGGSPWPTHEPATGTDDRIAAPDAATQLLALHRETAPAGAMPPPHGSREHVAAIDALGRIEVEVARDRAGDGPAARG